MIRVRSLRNGVIETTEGVQALERTLLDEAPDWIAVIAPTPEELAHLKQRMGLHELSIRDALSPTQPPKLEDFGEHIFFVVHTPVPAAWSQTRKIAVFLSPRWILTMQRTESDAMDEIAARVEQDPSYLLQSPGALAHVVIDHMTGGFESLTADLLEEMTQLEDRVATTPPALR